mmetsp:Transcript_23009/g.91255  ORF Transcript_23009/g.91255 Transcript_23009/m.91255 type:complete len:144 (-) Transcript_23009:69-500(-)
MTRQLERDGRALKKSAASQSRTDASAQTDIADTRAALRVVAPPRRTNGLVRAVRSVLWTMLVAGAATSVAVYRAHDMLGEAGYALPAPAVSLPPQAASSSSGRRRDASLLLRWSSWLPAAVASSESSETAGRTEETDKQHETH